MMAAALTTSSCLLPPPLPLPQPEFNVYKVLVLGLLLLLAASQDVCLYFRLTTLD